MLFRPLNRRATETDEKGTRTEETTTDAVELADCMTFRKQTDLFLAI